MKLRTTKVAIFVVWDKKGLLVKYEKYGTLSIYGKYCLGNKTLDQPLGANSKKNISAFLHKKCWKWLFWPAFGVRSTKMPIQNIQHIMLLISFILVNVRKTSFILIVDLNFIYVVDFILDVVQFNVVFLIFFPCSALLRDFSLCQDRLSGDASELGYCKVALTTKSLSQ